MVEQNKPAKEVGRGCSRTSIGDARYKGWLEKSIDSETMEKKGVVTVTRLFGPNAPFYWFVF